MWLPHKVFTTQNMVSQYMLTRKNIRSVLMRQPQFICELPEKVTLNAVNSAKILGLSEKNSCKIERNSHSNYLAQYPNKSSVYQHS